MVTRRDFLKTMSMASAGLALGTGDLLHAQTVSPKKGRGDKVKIAYIGIGNRGEQIIEDFARTGMVEAVDMVGGPHIRNIGTIGGNTCNGVTSADSASTLFALDAIIELTGPEGIRRLPIREFYIKAGKVDIRQGELQTGILIPKQSYQGYRGHYIKYAMRNAMDIATLGCSANVKLSEDKTVIEDVRIAYGVAGPIPMRAVHAEEAGRGKEVSARILEEIAEQVLFDIHPRDSWRASKAFREHIARVLCQRALKEAIVRTGGVIHE